MTVEMQIALCSLGVISWMAYIMVMQLSFDKRLKKLEKKLEAKK